MLKRILYFSFIQLLLFATPTFGQNDFGSLLGLAQTNPDSLIYIINNDKELTFKKELQVYLLAIAFQQLGENSKVDSLYKYVFSEFTFENDSSLYANYLISFSNHLKTVNDFEGSINSSTKAIACCERIQDTISLFSACLQIGETYRALENYNLGLKYLNKAELLVKNYRNNANLFLAKIYDRKAAIFIEMGKDFTEINDLSLKTIAIASEIGDKSLEASSYNTLGFQYINKDPENPDTIAKQYFTKAIQLYDEMGSHISATNVRLNLSRYYNRKGEFQMGINTLLPIKRLVDSSDWIWEKGGYYEMLGRLYYSTRRFDTAYLFLEKAKLKLIELSENQYDKQLALLSVKHDVQQQKKETELAKLETKSKEDENKILYISLLSVFTFALAILIFLLISNKQKQKLRKQRKENIEINHQLSNALSQKETLLSELNHRVKNNLSILSGLLYLQQTKETKPDVKLAIKKSLDRINTISLIHESLYQRDDLEHVDFQEYLTKLINSNKNIYWDEDQPLEVIVNCKDLSPDLTVSIPLAMIINELVTNSFKYAFKNVHSPKIEVLFANNTLQYMDNGKGFESSEKSNSLGLKLITLFSEQINATVNSFVDNKGYHHHIKITEK